MREAPGPHRFTERDARREFVALESRSPIAIQSLEQTGTPAGGFDDERTREARVTENIGQFSAVAGVHGGIWNLKLMKSVKGDKEKERVHSASVLILQWDRSQVSKFREAGLERALTRAVSRAGGDAIRAGRVASSRSVRERKRMKLGRVNAALVLTFPKGMKHIDDLVWQMRASGAPVPVSEYPFRQTKRGVSVAINRGRRVLLSGAFVATMRSGHVGVFRRRGAKRLPIDETFTTRVSDVLRDTGLMPRLQARAQEVFTSSFARLLPLELAKAKR